MPNQLMHGDSPSADLQMSLSLVQEKNHAGWDNLGVKLMCELVPKSVATKQAKHVKSL
jgi:hypothetical protein